jgi:hypothetical protein
MAKQGFCGHNYGSQDYTGLLALQNSKITKCFWKQCVLQRVLRTLYLGLAGKFSNNFRSSLPYGCNLDLSCLTRLVNEVNPIG